MLNISSVSSLNRFYVSTPLSKISTNESFFDLGRLSDEFLIFHETAKHTICPNTFGRASFWFNQQAMPVRNLTEICPNTFQLMGLSSWTGSGSWIVLLVSDGISYTPSWHPTHKKMKKIKRMTRDRENPGVSIT